MGKIRVKTFGDEELEQKAKEKTQRKKEARLQKLEHSDSGQTKKAEKKTDEKPETEEEKIEQVAQKPREEVKEEKKTKKEKFQKKQKSYRSTGYFSLLEHVDRKKEYPVLEALGLLSKLQRGKFDETVELHINTLTSGISGNVTLPNGTGKKTKVVIASDALIAEIEKGIVNFDVLVAEPQMMAKLAKVARILGPRGLMPNPKNGTIADKPEQLVKKYESGQISFKTENKSPILHLTVGKMSFGAKKLEENIETLIKVVKKTNIMNITLKSTMSPGIKLKI